MLRRARLFGVVFLMVTGAAWLDVQAAPAKVIHEKIGEFADSPASTGIAINQSTGNVYVANLSGNNVVEYTSTGTEIRTITGAPSHLFGGFPPNIAVDNASGSSSKGDLYVPDPSHGIVAKFNEEGTFICELNMKKSEHPEGCSETVTTPMAGPGPQGAAVDPTSGDVYVTDTGNNLVDIFSPAGAYITHITGTEAGDTVPLSGPRGITVDALGDVYVVTQGLAALGVVEFKPSTEPATGATTWTESIIDATSNTTGLAIDSANDVFISDYKPGNLTSELNSAGTELSHFGESIVVAYGVAVNDASKEIYLTGLEENRVYIYNTLVLPTAVTKAATEVEHTSAKLEGTVNPEGLTIESCFFEYAKEEGGAFGAYTKIPCNKSGAEIGTGTSPVEVSAKPTGLTPHTKYRFNLVVESAGHLSPGATPLEFETPPLATDAAEIPVDLDPRQTILRGKVHLLLAGNAKYYFQYGPSTVSEHKTTPTEFSGEQTVSAPAPELEPETTYHAQLVVELEFEGKPVLVSSNEIEFKTSAIAPAITLEAPKSVTRTSALLLGEITPEKSETFYYFEYECIEKEDRPCAQPEPRQGQHKKLVGGNGITPVPTGPEAVRELESGALYRYRIVATNAGGTAMGAYGEFTTLAPTPAIVSGESGQATSPTTATVSGTVDPRGLPTSYIAEVGTEVVNGVPVYSTPMFGQVPEGGGMLSFGLTGLLPGTTYHFRIVAVNEEGAIAGPDVAFTTPGFPVVIVPPPPVRLVPIPPVPKPVPMKVETRAQKYAKAVKLCKRQPKKKRAACLLKAKRQFGPTKRK